MNLEKTLLYSIQKIPGDTAAEKFKYINVTSREIARNNHNYEDVPDPLKLLMNVEVGKILNNTNVIVKALLTSDALLCQRALQIPDLFAGKENPLLNWDYLDNELMSKISFKTRCKVIKKVSQDLQNKDPKYAETFYTEISKSYGQIEALPLLLGCSENFLNTHILEKLVELPERCLKKLLLKYPSFVISYLTKINSSVKLKKRILHCSNIYKYKSLIISLMDDHFETFIELLNSDLNFISCVGKRRTKKFLKINSTLLIENPKKYLQMLSLEIVSKQLNMDEFTTMMSNYILQESNKFDYFKLYHNLEHFSNEKKVLIIVTVFYKIFGKNLYDCPDMIVPDLLAILPAEQRIRIARIKLQEDNNWKLSKLKECWKVYLPFLEIFHDVKIQIAKQSDVDIRQKFINLLIYNCKINNDENALLEVLQYLSVQHKNENVNVIHGILSFMKKHCDVKQLNQSHWNIIIEIIKRVLCNINNNSWYNYAHVSMLLLLKDYIQFRLENNLNPDEYMRFFVINKSSDVDFHIFLHTNLNLEKISLEKFIDITEACYIENDDKSENNIITLLTDIEVYNDEVKKKGKCEMVINIEDHPSFIKLIETKLSFENKTYPKSRKYNFIKRYTEKYNPNLFHKWSSFMNYEEWCDYSYEISEKDICILKKNYLKILDNWFFYDFVTNKYILKPNSIRFLKCIRWYKDLPINFVSKCVVDLKYNFKTKFQILAILLNGNEYQDLINSFIPSQPKLDLNDTESIEKRDQIKECLFGMILTNSPVSLTLIQRLFNDNFLLICLRALYNACYRTPTAEVISFLTSLLNERVSISKKMIDLLYEISPMKNKVKIFKTFLESESEINTSLHVRILKKAWKIFNKQPNENSWNLLQTCLRYKPVEDLEMLRQLTHINYVSNDYVFDYIKQMIDYYNKVKIEGYENLSKDLIETMFFHLDDRFADILPCDFQQELIQNYMFDSALNKKKALLSVNFLFQVYLNNNNVGTNIHFFSHCLKTFIQKYFNQKIIDAHFTFPANKMLKDIVNSFIETSKGKKVNMMIVNALEEVFESSIHPWDDITSYFFITWIKQFNRALSAKEFGTVFGQKLQDWIDLFGPQSLSKIMQLNSKFTRKIYENEKYFIYDFIDGLLENKNNMNVGICAGLLLFYLNAEDKRFNIIIEKIKYIDSSFVRALVNEKLYSE